MNSTTTQASGSETRPATDRHARGRDADKPTGIPASGWKDIAFRLKDEVSDDRVMLIAAGVTFYLLLALGPLLAALVSVYGLILDPKDIAAQTETLGQLVPGGGMDILTAQIERLANAERSSLGIAFGVSLALALWSANAGMKAMFEAMNVAYDESEDRGFIRLTLVTMAITVSSILGILALLGFNALFSSFQDLIGLQLPVVLVHAVTALLALAALILFMAVLYRYGPSRSSPRWRWITPGAVFAGVVAVLVSAAFTWYVSNFGSYNETYGSLGAVVGFLTWLWLVVVVLVMGGELNAEMEHQTAEDTTTGDRQPMGQRGAIVADDLGETHGKPGTS